MSTAIVEVVDLEDFESEFDWSQIELLAEEEAALNATAAKHSKVVAM